MKNKITILIFLIFILPQIISADLPVLFDCNRFLTKNNNTTFEITYKIFHKNLQFKKLDNRLSAQMDIKFLITNKKGKELYHKDYSQLISEKPGKTTIEPEAFFIDKIKAQVTPGTYQFVVKINDRLSGEKIVWNKTLNTLDTNRLAISDLEINSFYRPDTTGSFTDFKRDNIVFLVNPNHKFNTKNYSSFAYYFEAYFPYTLNNYPLFVAIRVFSKKDSVYYQDSKKFIPVNNKKMFYGTIPILDWKPGNYKIIIGIKDLAGNNLVSTNEMLFIPKPEKEIAEADIEAEYKYVKYFFSIHDKKIYRDLDNRGKLDFIKKFWRQNDPNPITGNNEFKEKVIKRLQYANKHFSHFKKGWETDRGRIYIRRGKPEEVIEQGYDFKAKPYIIWKYYTGGKRVYIFVDFSGQGNYKLVYSENDEKEFTDPNWIDYLGPYFNRSEME